MAFLQVGPVGAGGVKVAVDMDSGASEARRWLGAYGQLPGFSAVGLNYQSGLGSAPIDLDLDNEVYRQWGVTNGGSLEGADVWVRGTCAMNDPGGWPTTEITETTPGRTLEELRELIEAEADPEKLQQLKDELAELTGTKPGGNDNG